MEWLRLNPDTVVVGEARQASPVRQVLSAAPADEDTPARQRLRLRVFLCMFFENSSRIFPT